MVGHSNSTSCVCWLCRSSHLWKQKCGPRFGRRCGGVKNGYFGIQWIHSHCVHSALDWVLFARQNIKRYDERRNNSISFISMAKDQTMAEAREKISRELAWIESRRFHSGLWHCSAIFIPFIHFASLSLNEWIGISLNEWNSVKWNLSIIESQSRTCAHTHFCPTLLSSIGSTFCKEKKMYDVAMMLSAIRL